jgi:hypothetical protein
MGGIFLPINLFQKDNFMKKEFNLDQVTKILGKHNLSNFSFNNQLVDALEEVVFELLEYDIKKRRYIFVSVSPMIDYSKIVFLNEKYQNYDTHTDITTLEFSYLYPSIFVKLIKEKKIKFNIYGFAELYVFIFENIKTLKARSLDGDDENAYRNARALLNSLYGVLVSRKKRFLYSNMRENLIIRYLVDDIIGSLNFTSLIGADVDILYFDLSSDISKSVFELATDDFKRRGFRYETNISDINFSESKKFSFRIRTKNR